LGLSASPQKQQSLQLSFLLPESPGNKSPAMMHIMDPDDFEDSPRNLVVEGIDALARKAQEEEAGSQSPVVTQVRPKRRKKRHAKGAAAVEAANDTSDVDDEVLPCLLGRELSSPCKAGQGDCQGTTFRQHREDEEVVASRPASRDRTKSETWPDSITTVMIRNIPVRYTAEELLAELLKEGFQGTFDFFYLPIDFKTKCNRGYGFVNFRQAADCRRFAGIFNNWRLSRYASKKVLEITAAITQGFEANVAQYARKDAQRVKNEWFKPMIFAEESDKCSADEALRESAS